MPNRHRFAGLALALALAGGLAGRRHAQTLRIGLAEDPDVLDPTLARTFVGRIVFASLCDKLFDIDEKLNIVPQLATSYEWSADNKALTLKLRPGVTFHDGEKLDAAAVKYSLERHKTMPGSNRRGELALVVHRRRHRPGHRAAQPVRAVLPAAGPTGRPRRHDRQPQGRAGRRRQVRRQSRLRGPVQVRRARRAGPHRRRALSPTTGTRAKSISTASSTCPFPIRRCGCPTCARGNSTSSSGCSLPTFRNSRPMRASRSPASRKSATRASRSTSAMATPAQKNPLGRDPRVREAFELSLDREGIVQVAMDGESTVGNQWVPPTNSYYAKNMPVPKRDVARAKALLQEAGVPNPVVHADDADQQRRSRRRRRSCRRWRGKRDSTSRSRRPNSRRRSTWPTRASSKPTCWRGAAAPIRTATSTASMRASSRSTIPATASPRWMRSSPNRARRAITAERHKLYEQLAAIALKDRPIIYLYHRNWLWAYTNKLSGLRTVPDGLVRVQGLRFN